MTSPTTRLTKDFSMSDPSTPPKMLDFNLADTERLRRGFLFGALQGLQDVATTQMYRTLQSRPGVFPTNRLFTNWLFRRSGSARYAPSNLTGLFQEIEDWLSGTAEYHIGTSARDDVLEDVIEIPTGVDKRHEPLIRGKGVPVWILVSYATKRGMSAAEVSGLWKGYVTEEEVRAALAYWRAHPENVEDKLNDAG